ncbi:MAG: hypothetical protein CMP59_05320 [Flavobacteriales bacterium]|nr:hypothetical protein [Flavobacteriales bacterium]
MKKRLLLSSFTLVLALMAISIILSSSSNGRAFAGNSGNTGAPGEPTTCGSCHAGGSYGATTYQIELLDSNNRVVSSYNPGDVYTLRGTFTTPSGNLVPAAYGFQVVSLINTNGTYNAWSSPSANTRIASAFNGRSYAEQNGPITNNTFSVSWTAPSQGSGPVDFYSASNGINNNRGTSGDNGYSDQLTITENVSTAINEVNLNDYFNFYPNPVRNTLNVENANDGLISLRIFDYQGRQQAVHTINGTSQKSIDLSNLSDGLYLIQLEDQSGNKAVQKLIKQ